jgi:hypothetical protein
MAAKPGCNTAEAEDDMDKKVYNTKKVLFVDSYGVKSLTSIDCFQIYHNNKQVLYNFINLLLIVDVK